jgi:uncharacterized iron-regulated protein
MHDWYDTQAQASLEESAALDRLAAAAVALLGEQHDRAQDHLWQAHVLSGLADRGAVVVGIEMLPWHKQSLLDAWTAGRLDEPSFVRESGWSELWGFDFELYAPVFRLCRARRLSMRALNIDRPLVSAIGRDGWEAVPAELRGWLTPACAAPPAYRRYLFEVTGGARPGRTAQSADDPAFDRFVRAQQAWDRAFACAIAAARTEAPGSLIAGLIGRGHLEYGYGTPAQLADLGVASVSVALPTGDPNGDRRVTMC